MYPAPDSKGGDNLHGCFLGAMNVWFRTAQHCLVLFESIPAWVQVELYKNTKISRFIKKSNASGAIKTEIFCGGY